jgi:ribosomal protein S18 acetylase RimI-like enzyme
LAAGEAPVESGGRNAPRLLDLQGAERERALPILIDGFVGIYRWHAKRTLRRIASVRGAELGGEVVGVSMLELLTPEVGYVYYVAVLGRVRRLGIGGYLLDDALGRFRASGATVVYAAVEEENAASERLFLSRGFRRVDRREPGYREGGLGAWGLHSRMMLVRGEVLFGLRFHRTEEAGRTAPPPGAP